MKKKFLMFLMVLVAGLVLVACGGSNGEETDGGNGDKETGGETQEETMVLRLADNQPDDYPTVIGDKEFARLVEEKTDGRIKIEVYSGGQLGDERSAIEQVQLGSLDFARVNSTPMSEFVPQLGVLALPYLFDSGEDMWDKLLGDAGQELLDSFEGSGFVGLAFYDNGERSYYTSVRPIKSPEDMEGLKIRVQNSQLAIDIVEAFGASATPMEYGEVYSALQTGIVDGAENNFPSYHTSNHYQVAKYFTLNGYQRVPEILVASEQLWNKLSDEDKEIIKEAALESVNAQRESWDSMVEESRDAVVEAGTELVEVEDLEAWREAAQPVYDKYGPEYGDWLDKFSN